VAWREGSGGTSKRIPVLPLDARLVDGWDRRLADRGRRRLNVDHAEDSSAFFSAPAPALFSNSSSSAVVISIASVITPSAIQPRSPVGGRGIGGEYLGRLTRCAAG
jgi:hypothetical protein